MKDGSNVVHAEFSTPPAAETESPALVVIGFDECAPLSDDDLDHLRRAIQS